MRPPTPHGPPSPFLPSAQPCPPVPVARRNAITLRPYQSEAVRSLFDYYEENDGNALLVLPTASGKSIIQAEFIRQVLAQWPDQRFLLLTHVKELIEQNASKLKLDVGIYSAGLGLKQVDHQITIAGIQSAYKHPERFGRVDLVMIDEAHLVSKTSATMYRKFLDGLRKICPRVKVIGMTATPFRLDSGPLHRGKDRLFTDVAYSISIKELISQGYLCRMTLPRVKSRIDTAGVGKRGGEFIPGELAKAANVDSLTEAALDEVETLCADHKSWLVFCVGVDHAHAVTEAIRARGYAAETITGKTPKGERDATIKAFKAGKVRALVSVGVLTTGFDAPNADAIIMLRPTMSPGLYCQMIGRGMRLHPGKTDCLVLEFTANLLEHGPIDLITIDSDGEVKTQPYKLCPECEAECHPAVKVCACGFVFVKICKACAAPCRLDAKECPDCGASFARPKKIEHETKAQTSGGLISDGKPIAFPVERWEFTRHQKRDKPDSLKVTYTSPGNLGRGHSEWVCVEHSGYASQKAAMWWVRRGGEAPTPRTVDDALGRVGELEMPTEIGIKRDGKYWKVT